MENKLSNDELNKIRKINQKSKYSVLVFGFILLFIFIQCFIPGRKGNVLLDFNKNKEVFLLMVVFVIIVTLVGSIHHYLVQNEEWKLQTESFYKYSS
jgi:hypothetical protein